MTDSTLVWKELDEDVSVSLIILTNKLKKKWINVSVRMVAVVVVGRDGL